MWINHKTEILIAQQSKTPSTSETHLIPLINIVFLMLIFFMVAGHIAEQDTTELIPPQSTSKQGLTETALTIIITADGNLWINNQQFFGESPKRLEEQLQTHIKTSHLNSHTSNSLEVVLKVDSQLSAKVLDPVLQGLRTLNVNKFHLATIDTNT